jgi:hypothetical protein
VVVVASPLLSSPFLTSILVGATNRSFDRFLVAARGNIEGGGDGGGMCSFLRALTPNALVVTDWPRLRSSSALLVSPLLVSLLLSSALLVSPLFVSPLSSFLPASPLLSVPLFTSSLVVLVASCLVVLPTLRSHFLPLVCDPQLSSLLAGSSFVLPTPSSCLLAPHSCLADLFYAGCWIELC